MEYRNRIGSIVHGETLFEGTIYENLNFGQPIANEENLKWALDGVQLTDFIKSLPEGLETAVFQEGRQLSASNAQKILLARSILHKPKILFYEDPTDVIDDKIAKQIIDFITNPINKWTVLVSSKNQYWKTKCNREIQLKNGTIILDK
jgi:ABC-type bacteriocin/lantibiotic exporter with double-glycine peptidase domain